MTTTTNNTAEETYEVTELFFEIDRDENGNDLGDDTQLSGENTWSIPATDEAYDALMSKLALNYTDNAGRGEDAVYVDLPYITVYRYVGGYNG
ncbi:hypothetical protein CH252_05020 [Rhodococcus sp. 06-1477-1B]|nr:hypothetical protein CH252_05020 [Rhodococcus sp. 06-1477-1B]